MEESLAISSQLVETIFQLGTVVPASKSEGAQAKPLDQHLTYPFDVAEAGYLTPAFEKFLKIEKLPPISLASAPETGEARIVKRGRFGPGRIPKVGKGSPTSLMAT
ncbi:MAG: hypothetical protein ACO1RA_12630 [Planctomycetaceae bacterium]